MISLFSVPPLSTEAVFPLTVSTGVAGGTYGPPSHDPFHNPDYSQADAFSSAQSLATKINSTVPFAKLTGYTLGNLYSFGPDGNDGPRVPQYYDECPSGMGK